MHELAIAESLLKIVSEEAAKHGLSRISRVRLRIGKLSTVVPEALQFSFDVIKEGTPAGEAELSIETVPVMARCEKCGIDFEADSFFFLCPQCDEVQVTLLSGKELEIVDIEGE